jgi:hypothetical protein
MEEEGKGAAGRIKIRLTDDEIGRLITQGGPEFGVEGPFGEEVFNDFRLFVRTKASGRFKTIDQAIQRYLKDELTEDVDRLVGDFDGAPELENKIRMQAINFIKSKYTRDPALKEQFGEPTDPEQTTTVQEAGKSLLGIAERLGGPFPVTSNPITKPIIDNVSGRSLLGGTPASSITPLLSSSSQTPNQRREGKYDSQINTLATQNNVPPAFIKAIIKQESNFNPHAKSNKGARGLMQLMPGTARDLGVEDSTDPNQNLRGGVQYLSQMYEQFGNWVLALAAYNAGIANVQKFNGVPPFPETRDYIERIIQHYKKYANVGEDDSIIADYTAYKESLKG